MKIKHEFKFQIKVYQNWSGFDYKNQDLSSNQFNNFSCSIDEVNEVKETIQFRLHRMCKTLKKYLEKKNFLYSLLFGFSKINMY